MTNNEMNNINLYNDISNKLSYSYRKRNSFKKIFQIYQYLGVFVASFGILYLVVTTIDIKLDSRQTMAVLIIGSGIFISIISWVFTSIYKTEEENKVNERNEIENSITFILSWMDFEKQIDQDVKNDNTISKYSIANKMDKIYNNKIIDEKDLYILERALKLRNEILHKGALISEKEVKLLTTYLNQIAKKISSKKNAKTIHNAENNNDIEEYEKF